MIIIGAGMAGLIAANYFRRYNPTIIELQPSLPNNHHALLRFRTNVIGEAVGIPFRKVDVRKEIYMNGIYLDKPNVYVANQYSMKVTGGIRERSVWDIEPCERYIAPKDFIDQLAQGLDIRFGQGFVNLPSDEPVISTIPMSIMMDHCSWTNQPKFGCKKIWSLTATVGMDVDVCQTIYFPDNGVELYRASLVGNQLIAEYVDIDGMSKDLDANNLANMVLTFFGIPEGKAAISDAQFRPQQFGKIIPVDENIRKDFIYTMTRDFGIYSLGRFATWRQLLLDDLVGDLKIIDGLISAEKGRSSYNQSLSSLPKN